MGLLKLGAKVVFQAVQTHIGDQAFEAGLNGWPRPIRLSPTAQAIADRAYADGQQARATNLNLNHTVNEKK